MWLIIMFDLPTTDSEARADYRHFHDFLLKIHACILKCCFYLFLIG